MTEKEILEVQPVVSSIAYKFSRQVPPSITYDELEAAAWDGVLDFAPRFDPSRGVPFRLAVRQRINGSIQDYLRKFDPLTRDQRSKVRAGEIEPPVVLIAGPEQHVVVDNSSLTTILQLESATDLKKLWRGSRISGRKKRIFRAYFFQERHMSDIAASFKIHESRVSQVIAWCLKRLRLRVLYFKNKAERKCPCGRPLRFYDSYGVRDRGKYCSAKCRVHYLTARVCRECSRPVWKQMVKDEYRPGERRGRGTRCRFHFLLWKSRLQSAIRTKHREANPLAPRIITRDSRGRFTRGDGLCFMDQSTVAVVGSPHRP